MEISQKETKKIENYIKNNKTNKRKNFTLFNTSPENYAAIYARISGQNESFSISSQIETCKRYAEDNGLIVYDIYEDKQSARMKHFYSRPSFKKLLNDLECGMFKNIIMIRRDRLSRRIDDFMHLRRIFNRLNVNIIYVKEGNFNLNSNSYVTNFIENVLVSISTLEPEYIYQRTKGGRQNLRSQGIFQSSTPPIGYSKGKEAHSFIINKNEAKVIEKIFNTYEEILLSSDKSLTDLRNIIKDSNILINTERPKTINNDFLKRVITRPIYGGKLIESEDDDIHNCVIWHEDTNNYSLDESKFIKCVNFESIVSWRKWKRVFLHHYFKKNGPKTQDSPFENILYCKRCGSYLKLDNKHYSCPKNCLNIPIDTMISGVTTDIIRKIDNYYFQIIFKENIKKVNEKINTEKKKLLTKERILKEKVINYIDSNDENKAKEIEFIKNEITTIKKEINKLGDKKLLLTNTLNNTELFKQYFRNLNDKDINFIKKNPEAYSSILSKFISKVVCDFKNEKLRIKVYEK
ncbi:MAG: hypothetical protein FH751_14380 [Firmicutes bacterium]|nr:hypothetical protein [Bacillota bacterium]